MNWTAPYGTKGVIEEGSVCPLLEDGSYEYGYGKSNKGGNEVEGGGNILVSLREDMTTGSDIEFR